MEEKTYNKLLNEVIEELLSQGFSKDDFTSKNHDNETVEYVIYCVIDEFIDMCDGFNYIEHDLGTWQRKDLVYKLYDGVIKYFNN